MTNRQRVDLGTDVVLLLEHLHRGGQYGFWWLTPAKRSVWWEVGGMEPLHVSASDSVYFGVHPTSCVPSTNANGVAQLPEWVRSQRRYIAAVNCLFAEFDSKDFGGDIRAVYKHVQGLPVPASAVIMSGGGLHVYWLLRDPFVILSDDHRDTIGYVQKAWSKMVGADASKDLPRVLRVPETWNSKYSPIRPVLLLECDMTRLYTMNDLIQWIPLVPASTPTPSPRPILVGDRPIDEFNRRPVDGVLEQYGYKHVSRARMLSPYSTTGSPGVYIDEATNRAFCHHQSDPLCTGYWNRPFDVVKNVACYGNWREALHQIVSV